MKTANENQKWTIEEMRKLADLVMDDLCEGKEVDTKGLLAGTGWTEAQFNQICDLRWNGPSWCR
jgi:hypothetical protein